MNYLSCMTDENWIQEYKTWKFLKPSQIHLLDEGARTLSQAWLLNAMWCEWKDLKQLKQAEMATTQKSCGTVIKDPWED